LYNEVLSRYSVYIVCFMAFYVFDLSFSFCEMRNLQVETFNLSLKDKLPLKPRAIQSFALLEITILFQILQGLALGIIRLREPLYS